MIWNADDPVLENRLQRRAFSMHFGRMSTRPAANPRAFDRRKEYRYFADEGAPQGAASGPIARHERQHAAHARNDGLPDPKARDPSRPHRARRDTRATGIGSDVAPARRWSPPSAPAAARSESTSPLACRIAKRRLRRITSLKFAPRRVQCDGEQIIWIGREPQATPFARQENDVGVDGVTRTLFRQHAAEQACDGPPKVDHGRSSQQVGDRNLPISATSPNLRNDTSRRDERRLRLDEEPREATMTRSRRSKAMNAPASRHDPAVRFMPRPAAALPS